MATLGLVLSALSASPIGTGARLALRAAGLSDTLLAQLGPSACRPLSHAPPCARSPWVLQVDGSSGGSGLAASGAGALLFDPHGRPARACARFLGRSDSCAAEYAGLELGLRMAAEFAPARLAVCGDARVVLDCAAGLATPRRMRAEHARVVAAASALGAAVSYLHVPRERNAGADALARQAVRSASVLASELLRAAALSHDGERAARLLRDARAHGLDALSRDAWLALIAACELSDGAQSAARVAQAAALRAEGSAAELLAESRAHGAWRSARVDEHIAVCGESALARLMAPAGLTCADCSDEQLWAEGGHPDGAPGLGAGQARPSLRGPTAQATVPVS